MELTCRRFEYGSNYTISRLYVDGVYECYVLEDLVRAPGVKVDGETAIPAGKYKVIIDFSPHFKKDMLHILDVPMFAGIRIHSGNTDKDTEGCLLVGKDWGGKDCIYQSVVAFNLLFPKIQHALTTGEEVNIEVVDTK